MLVRGYKQSSRGGGVQGLTLVHFPTRPQRLLWDTMGCFMEFQ